MSPTQRPLWIDSRLRELPARPWRKIHLDYHNSQHMPRLGNTLTLTSSATASFKPTSTRSLYLPKICTATSITRAPMVPSMAV